MKFSIVTIVFNGSNYIEETILSVINQDYNNIEYIVIDGASSDNTLEIINKYSSKISKIVSEKDLGIYDAMNKGLSICTGDYVVFMNGGDWFPNEKVLSDINMSIKDSNIYYDFIYGDSFVKTNNTENLFYKKSRNHSYFWYGMFANHQAMLYKLDIIKKYSLKFDLEYIIGADYKFTLQFLNFSNKYSYLNQPFCVFSLDGISNKNKKLGLNEASKARAEVLGYGKMHLVFIKLLITTVRFIENNFGWLYTSLRFTRKSTN